MPRFRTTDNGKNNTPDGQHRQSAEERNRVTEALSRTKAVNDRRAPVIIVYGLANLATHTGYTSGAQVVSSSGEFSTTYRAWKAFDGAHVALEGWIPSGGQNGWLMVDLGATKMVNELRLKCWYGTETPKDMVLEGSANGSTWTEIKHWKQQTNYADLWVPFQNGGTRVLRLNRAVSFRYFRLTVTGANSNSTLRIGELELWMNNYQYPTATSLETAPGGMSVTANDDGTQDLAITGQYNYIRSLAGKTSGKWYWEIEQLSGTDRPLLGVMRAGATLFDTGAGTAGAYGFNGRIWQGTGTNAFNYSPTSWANGDVLSFRLDIPGNKLEMFKNGELVYTWTSLAWGSSGAYQAAIGGITSGASNMTVRANFGTTAFHYPELLTTGVLPLG